MKTIARETESVANRGQTDRDVKLGRGGIREVELVVQILQAKNALGQRSTIPALTEVHDRQLISREDFDQLREAYLFLRDVENKLQMVDDLQTHSLPEDHAALTVCARLLGYPTADPLLRDLQRHKQNVNRIFVGVLGTGLDRSLNSARSVSIGNTLMEFSDLSPKLLQ